MEKSPSLTGIFFCAQSGNNKRKVPSLPFCIFAVPDRLMKKFIFLILVFSAVLLKANAQTDTVLVFVNPGCARCLQTESYLTENKIPFKIYSFHDKAGHQKLGNYLNEIGFKKGETLTFPVVVSDGKVNVNIPDLDAFLPGLLKKKIVTDPK